MGLSFGQYNFIYYFVQYGLFLVIYVFIVVCIPYDLMGWIAETVLFLKDGKKNKSKGENMDSKRNADTKERNNGSFCCCIWKPLNNEHKNTSTNWRSRCCLRWLFRNPKPEKNTSTEQNMNTEENMNKNPYNPPPWCICRYVWELFAKFFECECRCCKCCKCCKCSGRNFTSDDCENCLINLSHCCCECDCGDDELKNRLP
jgi:hypothetical protein